ncbi:hypothetical protein CY35_04G062100, partial [Sphagnum magellanicum]
SKARRRGEQPIWKGSLGKNNDNHQAHKSDNGGIQQRWNPIWHKEQLKTMHKMMPPFEQEQIDEKQWWGRLEKLKIGHEEQEIVIKRNFGNGGAIVLENFARQLELHFHTYNQGKNSIMVVSKVPLSTYRPDLDERKKDHLQRQILIPASTEFRMETILTNMNRDSPLPKVLDENKGSSLVKSPNKRPSIQMGLKNMDKEKFNEHQAQLQVDNQFTIQPTSALGQPFQAFREQLPAYKFKSEFLEIVLKNQVVVVCGESGCGKSTQLPMFLLEDAIKNGRGEKCNIICTQPRRISAISLATRVAIERGDALGQSVGYQIHLEARCSTQTRLLFCTTPIFLHRLLKEPLLLDVSHVLVDEIHERGMNEDFLIIILRELIPRRPNLRVILMSATFNVELFSHYFGGAAMMNIPGFMFPVKELFLEDVLELTKFVIKGDATSCPGDGQRDEKGMDPIFKDVDVDTMFANYSKSTQLSLQAWMGEQVDLHLVEVIIEHICTNNTSSAGAILVFLPGWDEISKLIDQLKANVMLRDGTRFLLLPLHASMPTINQSEIFQLPPPGVQKIILSTNIAETSVTIEDVAYVIDCGKAKDSSYDVLNTLACLQPSWISKASVNQRKGRAGRVTAGTCYHLFPKLIYNNMPEYQTPEILRKPLPELCLQLKSLICPRSITHFLKKAMEPPNLCDLQNAIDLLIAIGAMDGEEVLTPLGHHLAKLPVDPRIGKIILLGPIFRCMRPSLIIASAMVYHDPFVHPIEYKDRANEAHKWFANNHQSDHIATLKAYQGWQDAKQNGAELSYCWDNFLSLPTLKMIEGIQHQFLNILVDMNFIDKIHAQHVKYDTNSHDLAMVKAILCAGLFPNVVRCKTHGGRTTFYTKNDGRVEPKASSVISPTDFFPHPWLVYTTKVQGTCYVQDLTIVSDYALLMFGGSLHCMKDKHLVTMMGGFLKFVISRRAMTIVQELRKQLESLFSRKLVEPHFDLYSRGKLVSMAVLELIHSNNDSIKSDGLNGFINTFESLIPIPMILGYNIALWHKCRFY